MYLEFILGIVFNTLTLDLREYLLHYKGVYKCSLLSPQIGPTNFDVFENKECSGCSVFDSIIYQRERALRRRGRTLFSLPLICYKKECGYTSGISTNTIPVRGCEGRDNRAL